ncbi:MAG: hypothetical protein VW622_13795 [Opitutae bacterium]
MIREIGRNLPSLPVIVSELTLRVRCSSVFGVYHLERVFEEAKLNSYSLRTLVQCWILHGAWENFEDRMANQEGFFLLKKGFWLGFLPYYLRAF